MNKLRLVAALFLALPLIIFGGNDFAHVFELPEFPVSPGTDLLQLPMSLGIVAFHATMLPEGLGMAAVMLVLNLVVMADGPRVRSLLGGTAPRDATPTPSAQ